MDFQFSPEEPIGLLGKEGGVLGGEPSDPQIHSLMPGVQPNEPGIVQLPMAPAGKPTLHVGEPKKVSSKFEGHTALQAQTPEGDDVIYHYKGGNPVEASVGKDTYFPDEINFPVHPGAAPTKSMWPELDEAMDKMLGPEKPTLHVGPLTLSPASILGSKYISTKGSTPEGGTVYYNYTDGKPESINVFDSGGNHTATYNAAAEQFAFPPAPKAAEPAAEKQPTLTNPSLPTLHVGPLKSFAEGWEGKDAKGNLIVYGHSFEGHPASVEIFNKDNESVFHESYENLKNQYAFPTQDAHNQKYGELSEPDPNDDFPGIHSHSTPFANYKNFDEDKPELDFAEPLKDTSAGSSKTAQAKLTNGNLLKIYYDKNGVADLADEIGPDGVLYATHLPQETNLPEHPFKQKDWKPSETKSVPWVPTYSKFIAGKPEYKFNEAPTLLSESKYTSLYKFPLQEGGWLEVPYDKGTGEPDAALKYDSKGYYVESKLPDDINIPDAPFKSSSGEAGLIPHTPAPVSTPVGQITYGNYNYPKLPKKFLTDEEADLIGNRRFTSALMEGEAPADIHKLNNIIEKYKLPEDTPVTRGINYHVFKKFDATPVGGTFIHSSLFQSSANPEFAKDWAGGPYIEVVLPKGTPAFPASNYTHLPEWEYVLQTGQRFKVLEKGRDDKGKPYIRAELVPRFRPIPQEDSQPLPHPLLGLHLYHSSPYEFQRFATSQVGTGESTTYKGTLLQGYGHYLAEEPAVAKTYFDVAKRKNITDAIVKDLQKGLNIPGPKTDEIVERVHAIPTDNLDEEAERYKNLLSSDPDAKPMLKGILARQEREFFGRPAFTYRTLAHVDPNYLLDSDRPLSEQSPQVKAALARAGIDLSKTDNVKQILPQTREEMLNYLNAGIQGVRYLDAKSRAKGSGTRNYVIYDEDALDIAHKGYMTPQGKWEKYYD